MNQSIDKKLLDAYIGNNSSKIMKKSFSIPALIFSWLYMLYRKLYIPSIIGMMLIILIGFLPYNMYIICVFIIVVYIGVNFNSWYVSNAQNQIKKIKEKNPNCSEEMLIKQCQKKGGTNVPFAIIIYLIFMIISALVNPHNPLYDYFKDINKNQSNKTIKEPEKGNQQKKEIIKDDIFEYNNINYMIKNLNDLNQSELKSINSFDEVNYDGYDIYNNKEYLSINIKIENGTLVLRNYYNEPYYFKSISNAKEILIRTFQSDESMYLIVLLNDETVYISHLYVQNLLTPEQIDNNLEKVEINEKIKSISSLVGQNLSYVSLETDNGNYYIDFEIDNELDYYQGTWHTNDDISLDYMIGPDELVIKKIEDGVITFDYVISGLCGEKNITTTNSYMDFKFETEDSKGTLQFKGDIIVLKVKSIYYDEIFEKQFKYKQ